jgi:hypothetical protein
MSNVIQSSYREGRDTRALRAYLGHENIRHKVRYTELSSVVDAQIY